MSEGIPILPADSRGIGRAVEALSGAWLVLHPTETVVSLSGDPQSPVAVERARRIKGYDEPRPFLCLVPDVAAARRLARRWPPEAERLAERFWPGPLTLVVEAAEDAPGPIAVEGTVALRPAADPVSQRLLGAYGRPVFSTSANRRDEAPTGSVREAVRRLADVPGREGIAVALESRKGEGGEPTGLPSTIVDVAATPPRVVREGALRSECIRAIVPNVNWPGRCWA